MADIVGADKVPVTLNPFGACCAFIELVADVACAAIVALAAFAQILQD